jgi:hypothetical protein
MLWPEKEAFKNSTPTFLTLRRRLRIISSMANVLSTAKRVQIVSALVEGVSVRATARMFDVSKDTVMKLGVELGEACARYQDETLRDLPCRRLKVDEIWSFVYAKQKNVPQDRLGEFGVGDVWTFTAIDAETKLIPSFLSADSDEGDHLFRRWRPLVGAKRRAEARG